MRIVPSACILALATGGCTLVNQPVGSECGACTMEFRMVQVRVVDDGGDPVEDLDVVVRNERTGTVLDVEQESGGFGPGTYAVVTDGNVNDLSEDGDTLLFQASEGTRVAEGTFVVGRDRCACHIVRQSGPERLVAR